ncbi:MAG TPA: Uma2 family endonuclease [Pseudonocardiaceae bacterium]|nr:Uma2 family endonuclease [Pseudonocardiaceae bacterium]
MAAQPDSPSPEPDQLQEPLTVADFMAIDGENHPSLELQEGSLVMSPFASPAHMYASARLVMQIERCLPPSLVVLQEAEIDLQFVAPGEPGTVRRANLAVVHEDAYDRIAEDGGCFRADEVLLAIEIVSPGTKRMDRVVKRAEYADAGIRYYWIVDLEKPISVLAMHLADDFGYVEDGEVTGVCTVDGPFRASLGLDELAR